MNSENIQDIYPLSPMQQGMLFHSIYSPESGAYIEQTFSDLVGDLNVAAFEQAWQAVIDRNPVLRTAFVWEGVDEPMQVVFAQVDFSILQQDWRQKSGEDQDKDLQAYLQKERAQGFDLTDAPLMRIALFRTADDVFKLVWTHHHLLIDGWSNQMLLQELFALYNSFDKNISFDAPERPPFRAYIDWLQNQDNAKAEKYWQRALAGFSSPTPLVVDKTTPVSERANRYDVKKKMLSAADSQLLRDFSKSSGVTLNTLVQGAWALLLSRYSRERDVIFGATVSGRPTDLPGAEAMLGLFINTLPVRVDVDARQDVLHWLQKVQQQQAESRNYEYSSLVQIKSWCKIPGDVSLFNSILVFESFPMEEGEGGGEQKLRIENKDFFSRTNFPITFVCSPGPQVGFEIAYECDQFDDDVIEHMLDHVSRLAVNMARNADARVSEVEMLNTADRQVLLQEWNGPDVDFPRNKCIHQLFEEKAMETPDKAALFFKGREVSYKELNERSNRLARYLRDLGVHQESMVAICIDRSVEMIVGALGVLKAGGAYVPIDPNYPQERIEYTLHDSGVSILLTQEKLLDHVPKHNAQTICLDSQWGDIASQGVENPNFVVEPENLAYIIYTSGSTGRPKGTLMQHRGLVSFVLTEARFFEVTPQSHVLQFASFSFDASVGEIFKTLAIGATLYLAPRETLLAVDDLTAFLQHHKIDIITMPPSLLTAMDAQQLPDVRVVASVGEACTWDLVKQWGGKCKFINGYGPTETTVGAIWGQVSERDVNTATPPIGHPIDNAKIYILDQDLNLTPVGVPGQIYIGGAGLSRGYLNRPDLTAERFMPNPFADAPGERMYRTGDLAKWLPDGRLVFEGRVDFQVKLRGFRIELGEIESLLADMSSVKDAAVVVREDEPGQKRLVAYLTPKTGAEVDIAAVAGALKEQVPDYMTPSAFVVLDSLPLTPNGKVNRKALPAPDQSAILAAEHVDPRTPSEELIVGIFQDVLHIDKVSVLDNFFALGGHSLLATQLLSRLREAFEIEFPLQKVFQAADIAQLAKMVDEEKSGGRAMQAPPIKPVARDGRLPLSFAQQRLWFLDQLEPNSAFYNIPIALDLTGDLKIDLLEKSINALAARHESLRTSFIATAGEPEQKIAAELTIKLEVKDLSALSSAQRDAKVRELATQEAMAPFNLAQGPLFRAKIYKLKTDEHLILFTLHHIIGDGWSVNILVREIAAFYQAFLAGKEAELADLPVQYADFSQWQRNRLQGETLESELDFWRHTLASSPPMLELPTDFPRPPVQSFNGDTKSRLLPADLSQAIKDFSREEGATVFMTLLAAFAALLYRYSHQDDFNIGTPIANRNRMETEGLIGFFVNNLVLRFHFDKNPGFLELLANVRRDALEAFAHQDIPFEMLVEALNPQRDMSHSPLFQVVFVMQNTPMGDLQLPDLKIKPIGAENQTAKFDLSLQAAESPEHIAFEFEYNSDLFAPETIERMLLHLELFLRNALMDPEQRIEDVPILAEGEAQLLLTEWTRSESDFEKELCAQQMFERFAAAQPDAVAACYEDEKLTYAELNGRANQLARYLRNEGVSAEKLVGISVRRSLDQIVAVLAVLKAGGAFLPIDPGYPAERIEYMLRDSGVSILLTQKSVSGQLPDHSAKMFCLDSDWPQVGTLDAGNLESATLPSNLAYVIYTSGSTGLPKGTMLQHQGMINLANAQKKAFSITPGKRILQFAPMSFDASVWETIMALLNGATLVLAQQDELATGDGLAKILSEQKVNVVTLPPSVLAVVPQTPLPDLTTIVTAGEKCPADLVERWLDGRQYVNAYGPTETTVCASMHDCDGGYPQGPPIGRPIDNAKLYVIDSRFNLTPVGVPGELCVGGPSLARGYLNRPELSAEKFIPNPFANDGSRLYRTGDLVRWLPEGEIEFLGRIDSQVKVRGFRIELGEIEAVLGEHPLVKDVIVLAKKVRADDARLVAYLVLDIGEKPAVEEMRAFVRARLPEYMTPASFVFLDAMPLTPSGKIDRHALPMPDLTRSDLQVEYVEPRNEAEAFIADICRELLSVDKVGVNDNFFDLGGHSLLATQLMSRIRNKFGVEVPLRVLFEQPTVAGLAESVAELKMTAPNREETPAITAVSREGRRKKLSAIRADGSDKQGL